MKNILLALLISLPTSAIADWTFVENVDPMTDEDSSFAVVSGPDRAMFFVNCDENNNLKAVLLFNKYLGNDNPPFAYRVDSLPAVEASAVISTTGRGVFPRDSSFVRELHKHDTITFRAVDFRRVNQVFTVSLKGIEEQISKLACY